METWWAVLAIGAGVGLLGGLLGKGGSAVATPLLHAAGIPAMVAVAAPLPATIPGTLAAASVYQRDRHVDPTVLRWGIGVGVPTAVLGALLTRWVDGEVLVQVTDVVVAGLGARILVQRFGRGRRGGGADTGPAQGRARMVAVAAVVGVSAGLLANSGGFLLAPLYLGVLRLPVRPALGTSLAVAAALAVPGTIVHAALGHVDWAVVAVFGLASVPLSAVGARLALRIDPARLEVLFGATLLVLGTTFLVLG